MPILLNKTIRLFLDSIGKREEYQFYLQRFHAAAGSAFALITPERLGFEEVAGVFSFDLRFLLRLEIFPAILLGGQYSREMRDMLFETEDIYEEMDLSGRIVNRALLAEIEAFLNRCRERQRIGVLLSRGCTNMEMLRALVPDVAKRVHLIRLRGPLHKKDGTPLQYYYTHKPDQPELADVDVPISCSAAKLLEKTSDLHISIASPWNLLEELFTIKGAGCLVRPGSIINRLDSYTEIDVNALRELMKSSFGRELKPGTIEKVSKAFIEKNYRGAALLEQHSAGWYLSKFAVDTQARGEGLAGEIWHEMLLENPALFWRARIQNPINHWYHKHSDGSHRQGEWIVFWRNIDWRQIPSTVEYCLARKDDFELMSSRQSE